MGFDFGALFSRIGYGWQKHGTKILTGVTVVSSVAAVVTACIETYKLVPAIEEYKADISAIRQKYSQNPDDKMEKSEARKRRNELILHCAKCYALPFGLTCTSVVSSIANTRMADKQYASLASAYAILDAGFKQYKQRVAERYGEEAEKEVRYDIHTQEVEETDEDGNVIKTETVPVVYGGGGPDTRFFGYGYSTCSTGQLEADKFFLTTQQEVFNHQLRARRFLFLNEVLEELGFDKCVDGQSNGWIYDKKNPNGDNYVLFTITQCNKIDQDGNLIEGFVVEFNTDGNIIKPAVDRGLMKK